MSKPVETPKEDLHTRMTRMETTLQFVATKEDLAKLAGKMDGGFANQRAETDAKLFRHSLANLTILLSAIAVATTVILRALP